jgi:hypothetical protein
MREDRGVLADEEGTVSGMEEYKYDKVPVTGPDSATVYEVEKWGVAREDIVTRRPFGVGKSRIVSAVEFRVEYELSAFHFEAARNAR